MSMGAATGWANCWDAVGGAAAAASAGADVGGGGVFCTTAVSIGPETGPTLIRQDP